MITFAISLLVITAVVLLYGLFINHAKRFPRLKDIYKEKYLKEMAELEKDLSRRLITQKEYATKNAQFGRDLLVVAKESSRVSFPVILVFALLGFGISAGSLYYFWEYKYDEESKSLDQGYTTVKPDLQKWLDNIPLSELKMGKRIVDFPLPQSVSDNPVLLFKSLNRMSSETYHSDPKLLFLLGTFYLDVGELYTAYDIFFTLNRIIENDFYVQVSMIMLEFEIKGSQLTDVFEEKFDAIAQLHPEEYGFMQIYANLLIKSGKVEKAFHYYSLILENAPEDNSVRKQVSQLLALAESRAKAERDFEAEKYKISQSDTPMGILNKGSETKQDYVLNVRITIDDTLKKRISDTAVLYLFIRNAEQKIGPPLAAKQIPLNSFNWNDDIIIGDNDQILPNNPSISTISKLEIQARISSDGVATKKDGDIETNYQSLSADDQDIVLKFNSASE